MAAYVPKAYNHGMKRTSIWLKADHLKRLRAISAKSGVAVRPLIRLAISEFLSRRRKRMEKELKVRPHGRNAPARS